MLAPVLIIAYNRPDKLMKVIESLMICEECGQTALYVSLDGPKEKRLTDKKMIENNLEIIEKYRYLFAKVFVNSEPINLGLANHIIKSINWVLENNEKVIILEDDIRIISDNFLFFMNKSLELFNDSDIYQISAYTYPVNNLELEKFKCSIYKIRTLSCWGWATWKNKWSFYNHDVNAHYRYWSEKKSRIKEFDILGNAHFFGQLQRNLSGQMYSWAVRWYASWMRLGGYSLFPKYSLVENIGMDGTGTFTSVSSRYDVSQQNYQVNDWEVSFKESYELKKLFNDYFKNIANLRRPSSLKYRLLEPYKRLKNKFKNFVKDQIDLNLKGNTVESCTVHQPSKIGKNCELTDVVLNSYSYISRNSVISHAVIGKFCSVGPNCLIGWGIHPLNGISTSPMFYSTWMQNGMTLSPINKIEERKLIEIGNDVFIGMNVTILDGVKIGNGAVIGAGAVVSKNIPAYAVAIGNPIRILRFRFDGATISKLENSKWWDSELDKLQEMEKHFFDVDEILKII